MSSRVRNEIAELVKRCRKGDKQAWSELMKRVSPVIFSICRTMRLSREESFDVYGQVSYLLLTNLNKLRSPEKLLSYVSTTTKREVYALSKRSKFFEYMQDTELLEQSDPNHATPDELYRISKNKEILMKAMAMLPQRDYDLLRILFFESGEPDYEKASAMLDIPVSSIGPTRARSLAKLKKILKKEGFTFSQSYRLRERK